MDDEIFKKEKNRLRSAKYYEANREAILDKKRKKRGSNVLIPKDRYAYHVKKTYGITEREYLRMFDKQDGVCAICFKNSGKKRLAVDHCHKTGKVRGLLCSNCNTALGKFGDNTTLLQRAIYYLELYHGIESYSKKFEDYERTQLLMRSCRTLERVCKN